MDALTELPFLRDQREIRSLIQGRGSRRNIWDEAQNAVERFDKYIPKLHGSKLRGQTSSTFKGNFKPKASGLRLDNLATILCHVLYDHKRTVKSGKYLFGRDDLERIISSFNFDPLIEYEDLSGSELRDQFNALLNHLSREHPFGSVTFGENWILVIDEVPVTKDQDTSEEGDAEKTATTTSSENSKNKSLGKLFTPLGEWKLSDFLWLDIYIVAIGLVTWYIFLGNISEQKSNVGSNKDDEWNALGVSHPTLITKPNIVVVGTLKAEDRNYDLGQKIYQTLEDYTKQRGALLYELMYISLADIDNYPSSIPLWRSSIRDSIADAYNADILISSFGFDNVAFEFYCHYYPRSIDIPHEIIHDSLLYNNRDFLIPQMYEVFVILSKQPEFKYERVGKILNTYEDITYAFRNFKEGRELKFNSRGVVLNELGKEVKVEYDLEYFKDLE